MINNKNLGNISGDPRVDNLNQPTIAANTSATSAVSVPVAGWHVELTDPFFWGTVTINGSPWTPPVVSGAAGTVLTTDGAGNVSWEPCVHTLSFGSTGLLPSVTSSNNITVTGVLNIASGGTGISAFGAGVQSALGYDVNQPNGLVLYSGDLGTPIAGVLSNATGLPLTTGVTGTLGIINGGTGLTAVGANGTALVSNGTTLSYSYPLRATNISGGNANEVPYQTATNTTGFVAAGVTGQILKANTGAAPTWGSGTATIGTTPITLGATTPSLSGVSFVTLTQDPPTANDAATKGYVDSRTGALKNLGSVNAATTANITRSGIQTIDGVGLVAGNRVLVWQQTNAAEDGVYVVASGTWTYAPDAATWSDYVGALVFVANGTSYGGSSFTQTVGAGGTLGVTAQSWARIGSALQYNGGPGISVVGATISNTGVLSISGGTTGLTPSTPTTGVVTLAGTLAITNGGTGLTALGTGVQTAMGNSVNAAGGFTTFSGAFGTPTSVTLTNATGLPLTTGVTGTLPVANGGTGLTALGTGVATGLGSNVNGPNGFVTHDGNLGTPTAGTLTNCTGLPLSTGITGTLSIANGGTGQATANDAFNALAPAQTSNAGKFLTSDGVNSSWASVPPTTPGGSNGYIQYNNNGAFGGDSAFTYASVTDDVEVAIGNGGAGFGKNGVLTIANKNSGMGGFMSIRAGASTVGWTFTFPTNPGTNGYFLKTDGNGTTSWADAASGTVTSINVSGGTTGLTTSGGPVTTSGTITLAGTLAITNGGTGATTQAGAANSILPTQAGNAGSFLTTDGSNVSWAANPLGTVTSVNVSGGTTGLTFAGGPVTTSGTITMSGTLAVANGGTGVTTSTGSGNNVLSTSPTLVTPILGTPTSGTLTNCTGLPLSTGVAGTLAVANGGTGLTSYTAGDLLYASGATTLAKLGIGSSGQYLSVSGSSLTWANAVGIIGFTNSATPFNTAVGYGAGGNITTGGSNAIFGYNAGAALTSTANNAFFGFNAGINATGGQNTFVGSSAGYSITAFTGQYCVAVGYAALSNASSANETVAIGREALTDLTTGANNTAVGANAGFKLTTGAGNTALGYNALYSITTTSNNTAIGYGALQLGTTGTDNVAVGRTAAQYASGSGNVAIGRDAMLNTTTGVNTVVGYNALRSNITGASSAAFGYNALTNATGGTNIAFGHSAGSAITTGSGNTLVGAYTGTTTLTGACVISDGAGNIRLYTNSSGAFSVDGTNFGSSGQVLTSNGSAAAPTWQTPSFSTASVTTTSTTPTTILSVPVGNGVSVSGTFTSVCATDGKIWSYPFNAVAIGTTADQAAAANISRIGGTPNASTTTVSVVGGNLVIQVTANNANSTKSTLVYSVVSS